MMNRGTNLLWYRQGARSWNEALPLGNGRLGAMVYGGARQERLCLNEDTLWSGYPMFHDNPGAVESYRKALALVMEGKNREAQEEIEQHFEALWSQVYLALGDISLTMEHEGDIGGYRRALDMSTGVHWVEYEAEGVRFTRETFVSAPDQALVMRLTADRAGALNFCVHLTPALDAAVTMTDDSASFAGNCPTYVWHYGDPQEPRGKIVYSDTDETKGMGFCAGLRLILEGGSAGRQGGGIRVQRDAPLRRPHLLQRLEQASGAGGPGIPGALPAGAGCRRGEAL